jgi:hypothetical protein
MFALLKVTCQLFGATNVTAVTITLEVTPVYPTPVAKSAAESVVQEAVNDCEALNATVPSVVTGVSKVIVVPVDPVRPCKP